MALGFRHHQAHRLLDQNLGTNNTVLLGVSPLEISPSASWSGMKNCHDMMGQFWLVKAVVALVPWIWRYIP
jgi:hypothetical protein